jgi:coenzyme F420-reducing hydrogenase delta subunit
VKHIQDLLEQIGLEPERIRMVNISAAMASEFVAITEEMTEVVSNLGSNPLKVR